MNDNERYNHSEESNSDIKDSQSNPEDSRCHTSEGQDPHQTIHIIEPTLTDQTGHCHPYCDNLIGVDPSLDLHIWVNHQAKALFTNKDVTCHAIFRRKLRKIQQYFLYKKLLKTPTTIFVPTAGRIDMQMLDKLSNKKTPSANVVLHFHQFKRSPKKLAQLKQIASRNPNWTILATTQRLLNVFIDAGFTKCHAVDCALYTPPEAPEYPDFKYVLIAGAMRADKGIAASIEAIAMCQEYQLNIPFCVQCSPPSSGNYDAVAQKAIKKLHKINYVHLKKTNKTLDQKEYLKQFAGSICLQPYDIDSYHDKFSGVTLDAICCGAPIISTTGTWIADTINKYKVGVLITNTEPKTIIKAIQMIMQDYNKYKANCIIASQELKKLHAPENTLNFLKIK